MIVSISNYYTEDKLIVFTNFISEFLAIIQIICTLYATENVIKFCANNSFCKLFELRYRCKEVQNFGKIVKIGPGLF